MRLSSILYVLIFLLAASCSKVDNYSEPDGHLRGVLTDMITGKPLQSQQPNGFTIQLFEEGKSTNVPIVIPGKADGSFENEFIFRSRYRVVALEGAFFPVEPQMVDVGDPTDVNFDVMPFLAVSDVSVNASIGKITANYKIAREQEGDKIIERRTLVSSIPTVNNVSFDFQEQNDLSQIEDEAILSGDYTDEITGLVSGQEYYVRIAVRTDNTLGKYNYSEVFIVAVP